MGEAITRRVSDAEVERLCERVRSMMSALHSDLKQRDWGLLYKHADRCIDQINDLLDAIEAEPLEAEPPDPLRVPPKPKARRRWVRRDVLEEVIREHDFR